MDITQPKDAWLLWKGHAYVVAFVREDGRFVAGERFLAINDKCANAYADKNYQGQEWYVLDRDGRNINGGRDQA